MTYSRHAQKVMSDKGHKLTTTRTLVTEAIEKSPKALNAYEIANLINKNGKEIDTVSVYRTLSLLSSLNLVHKTSEGKFIACQEFECLDKSHCHHQFVCTSCGKIKEIHINDKSFIEKLNKKFLNIFISSHSFQFSGLCEECKK